MYSQIMVPLDGSKFAEAALPLALALSKKTGAAVRLVTVIEPVPAFAYEDWASSAEAWTKEYLAKLSDEIAGFAGGPISSVVLTGTVVDGLQKEAVARKVDLVVMASHGRGPVSRVWLGSVADRFVRQADRPVLLIRPEEQEAMKDPSFGDAPSFDSLLVPLDGSELSESALNHAIEFGELFGSAYHLTRIVAYPVDLASPYLPHTAQMNQKVLEEAKDRAAEYLESQAERMRRRGLRVTTSVTVDAQAGHGILLEAEAVGASAVAMATHGRTGLSRMLLGSTADKVLRGTHLPLLLHRPIGQKD